MGIKEIFNNWLALRYFQALSRQEKRIVIYSESGQDWHHFAPVIDYLTNQLDESVLYLTSDPNDPGLNTANNSIISICIGTGLMRTICFQWLKAGVMLMTMVDFNKFQLKRSIHPVSYAFMFHSLISTHMADHEDSYDHYDAILCAGPHQLKEIRKREAMLNLPPKKLFEHGYHRLEELLENRRPAPPFKNKSDIHVLLAPSWGENTILNVCGLDLTYILIEAGFIVTLRPHYQTRWNTPELIDNIADKYLGHPRFKLIEKMGDSESLYDSHVMITDWSGAGMDYGMGLEKPVVYIDLPPKARNDWWMELDIEPFESFVRDKIGTIISPNCLDDLPEEILKLLATSDQFRSDVTQLRKEWVCNLGDSAKTAAKALVQLADEADAKLIEAGADE
ncbi:MAG: CDP-glycerol--glycerophosphate glycerophosphotransferase [Pseudomonadota bacterium]|nr:CDP-glycerol--glycerophosphate glycerophosphotransferase [Pseudomonadota bacterium]